MRGVAAVASFSAAVSASGRQHNTLPRTLLQRAAGAAPTFPFLLQKKEHATRSPAPAACAAHKSKALILKRQPSAAAAVFFPQRMPLSSSPTTASASAHQRARFRSWCWLSCARGRVRPLSLQSTLPKCLTGKMKSARVASAPWSRLGPGCSTWRSPISEAGWGHLRGRRCRAIRCKVQAFLCVVGGRNRRPRSSTVTRAKQP